MSDKISNELARKAIWGKFLDKFFELKRLRDAGEDCPLFPAVFKQLVMETGLIFMPSYAETAEQIRRALDITDDKYKEYLNAMFFVHFKIHMNSMTEDTDDELVVKYAKLSAAKPGPYILEDSRHILSLQDLMSSAKQASA
jgi:hypothetical protein